MNLIKEYYDEKDKKDIKPHTKATAIQIGKPANLIKALRSIHFTNGVVTQVSDKEMSDGMALVGLNGFDCEMASGAVPAGIRKLRKQEIMKKDDVVVGILTGKQKDPRLSIDYHLNQNNTFSKPPVAK
jgi:threonine synthase